MAAGAGSMILMRSEPAPPPAPTPVALPAPAMDTTSVLVAAAPIPMGQTLTERDLRWQDWPAGAVPEGLITADEGMEIATGAIVRAGVLAGEPIRRERLIRSDNGGFLSAVLPSGMRAVAISIDSRGSSTAGGFVLPNDRVDVLSTYRDETASQQIGSDVHVAETILHNVRVLAIGKNVETDEEGNAFVDGETATLELTPSQAEMITLAQRTGQLSLVLRSLADATPTAEDELVEEESSSLTIVRFGIPQLSPVR